MANAYIVTPVISDAAIDLYANSSVSGSGASNVQAMRPSRFWRSTTTDPYIQGEIEDENTATYNTIVLGYMNAQNADRWRLRTANSYADLTASPLTDTDWQPAWGIAAVDTAHELTHYAHKLATPVITDSHFRIDFDWANNTDGYVQLGRLILGQRVEPARSVVSGWASGFEEPVVETVDYGGEETPRSMGARRWLEATWRDLTQSERDTIYFALLARGSAKDLALVIDPDDDNWQFPQIALGRVKQAIDFQELLKTGSAAGSHRFALTLKVIELARMRMR